MKAITLTQPWATLVAIGAKRIETRSWATKYRGPLLIHAAAGLGPVGGIRGFTELLGQTAFTRALEPHYGYDYTLPAFGLLDCLPFGAIVGQVNQIDCVATWPNWATAGPWFTAARGEQTWQVPPPVGSAERAFGDYTPGRWAHLYADARPLATPIPARGQLGLWNWEGSL